MTNDNHNTRSHRPTEHRCMLAATNVMLTHMKEHVRLDAAFPHLSPYEIREDDVPLSHMVLIWSALIR